MTIHSIGPRTKKYIKRIWIFIIRDRCKKKAVHKAGKYLGNKIAESVLSKTLATWTKSSNDNIKKQEPAKGIIIPPGKREKILNKLRKVL